MHQVIHKPFEKSKEERRQQLILRATLLERLEKDHRTSADFFAHQLLHRKYVNIEVNSRTVNCQLYQNKEPKNDSCCRFQSNSAAKLTQAYCLYLLPYGEFLARKRTQSRAFPHFFLVLMLTLVYFSCAVFSGI